MSRSRRPPKHHHHQHKRGWVQEKQMKLSSVEPKFVLEAVEDGVQDAEERNHCGGPNGPCDWCMSQPED